MKNHGVLEFFSTYWWFSSILYDSIENSRLLFKLFFFVLECLRILGYCFKNEVQIVTARLGDMCWSILEQSWDPLRAIPLLLLFHERVLAYPPWSFAGISRVFDNYHLNHLNGDQRVCISKALLNRRMVLNRNAEAQSWSEHTAP